MIQLYERSNHFSRRFYTYSVDVLNVILSYGDSCIQNPKYFDNFYFMKGNCEHDQIEKANKENIMTVSGPLETGIAINFRK